MRSLAITCTLLLHVVFLVKNVCDGACVCHAILVQQSSSYPHLIVFFLLSTRRKGGRSWRLTYSLEIKLWKEGKNCVGKIKWQLGNVSLFQS